MKNLITIRNTAILLVILTLSAISCSKDDDPTQTQGNYYMTAKIDGADYIAEESTSLVSGAANITGFYFIAAFDTNGNKIQLKLESPPATGTFNVNAANIDLNYTTGNPVSIYVIGGVVPEGTISITENTSEYMKGTFSFVGHNPSTNTSKVFSEGKFKAKKL